MKNKFKRCICGGKVIWPFHLPQHHFYGGWFDVNGWNKKQDELKASDRSGGGYESWGESSGIDEAILAFERGFVAG